MGTGLEYIDEPVAANDDWDFDPEFDLSADFDDFMRDVHPEPADVLAGFWRHVESITGIPSLEKARIRGALNAYASTLGLGCIADREVWS